MQRRRAFTLVEIVVVTALLALLAAVVLPRLSFGVMDSQMLLQRYIWAAVDRASGGVPLRLVVRRGRLGAEERVPIASADPEGEVWKDVSLDVPPPPGFWRASEPCPVGSDGAVGPWAVTAGEGQAYMVAVTGRVYLKKTQEKNPDFRTKIS